MSTLSLVAEHLEHRQDPPVLAGRRLEPELAEDLTDVALDRLELEDELVSDPLVRPTLRHEAQDLPLPRGELVER